MAQKLVRHGSRTSRYRDHRIDAAPTWLHPAEGEAAAGWMADFLEPDAHLEDDDAEEVLLGSGFDPSTLVADLRAGLF